MTEEYARALRDVLQPRSGDMLACLRELVHVESHAMQPRGVDVVGDLVGGRLRALGFSVDRVPGAVLPTEERWLAEIMLPHFDYGDIAHVRVARTSGTGVGNALLLADLDSAFTPGSTTRFPFRVEGDRAYGPGIADMKGGLTVLVYALAALKEAGIPGPAKTTIVMAPDEQAGSLSSRPIIEAEARQSDWCLCVECARDGGHLMGSRTHMGVARLDVYGREAHAGSNFAAGVNAIVAIARKIDAIAALSDLSRRIFVTVSEIHGGKRRSLIPGHACCTIDIRTPDADLWDETERALRQIADTLDLPGTRSELKIHAHRPAMPWTSETDTLIANARHAGWALGTTFDVIRSPAGGSASFPGAMGVPTLDGLGPSGGNLMTDQEYVEIPSLVERALLLALTIGMLARSGSPKSVAG